MMACVNIMSSDMLWYCDMIKFFVQFYNANYYRFNIIHNANPDICWNVCTDTLNILFMFS